MKLEGYEISPEMLNKAGIVYARQMGRTHGLPATTKIYEAEVKDLFKHGVGKSEIAKKRGIRRTSGRRIISEQ